MSTSQSWTVSRPKASVHPPALSRSKHHFQTLLKLSCTNQRGVSQNLSWVTNDSFCNKLLKSFLLIGYQQICHWFLSFVIEKRLCETGPCLYHTREKWTPLNILWIILIQELPLFIVCNTSKSKTHLCDSRGVFHKTCYQWQMTVVVISY